MKPELKRQRSSGEKWVGKGSPPRKEGKPSQECVKAGGAGFEEKKKGKDRGGKPKKKRRKTGLPTSKGGGQGVAHRVAKKKKEGR